jgi:S-adenosylmethionine synthetase
LVQVAYAIGVAQPVGLYVNTYGTCRVKAENGKKMTNGEIAQHLSRIFDMRPAAIVKRLGLRNPIFSETAAYGHMGRAPYTKKVTTYYNGRTEEREVECFTWEKLDYVEKLRKEFKVEEKKTVEETEAVLN